MTWTVTCELCGWQTTTVVSEPVAANLWLDHYCTTHGESQ